MKRIYFILFLLAMSMCIKAQHSPILEEYVQEGLRNNLALKQENLEIQKVLENIQQAKALFYPRVTFAPTYSLAAGGRRLQFPVGDLLNPVYSTLNKMTQTSVFPQIANVDELLAPNNFHDTKISVQYSIYNPEIQYNYLIQKTLLTAQEAKKKVYENELRYTIEGAYYQYLQAAEAIKIFGNAQKTLNELVRLNQKLVNNNVLTKDAVIGAEYEISKLNQQVAVATKNRETAKAYFNFLLNKELDAGIVVDSTNLSPLASYESLDKLSASALQNRQELNQLDQSILASKTAITLQERAAKRPSIFIGGNTGFQGFGYTFSQQAYGVAQLGLTWDLFKGYERKSKIQGAKIQTELLKTKKLEVEKQIELQVTQAFLELQATHENLRLVQDGVNKAENYFKVIDSRYRNNNVLYIEWVKAQNEVVTAQLQQSLARFDVLIKESLLNKVTAQ
ncbi:TolC family protein [Runella slithyformis]|uniref:Outer membrane efflux protein n=1 Tax=Runella slithyformis (strain ATCC 29530 / DSM 19594 / LMG 11500 / NCIMB 11436 / LSU 4) TaxID=761193 RepID=A0A7U3ZLE6_RUNSL|nr:TolC family protein [Runella slithyformis]AEI49345.1 outer membrane efflux protein [Runella slithyformis DSM 19594]